MQSTTRLAIKLASRPRIQQMNATLPRMAARRFLSTTRSSFKPTVTTTTSTTTSSSQIETRSGPLSNEPVSEPRHSDAYPNAPPAPASQTSQAPGYVSVHPDPPNTRYDVPSGPYATSAPYAHTHVDVTESASRTTDLPASSFTKEKLESFEPSSTSASPAHPVTTHRVPRVELAPHASADESMRAPTPYAESPSSAVRNASSPGLMATAKEGGLGIMESEGGVAYPERALPDRNPPPLEKESEEISKAGVREAWKLRK
ncbi:hypothetical protein SCHPADRAFT_906283 [Schizopora paradoxa]|uniref:Uncharacterized protein n=1 Tax=Schizopora paradoxa TaxID=27342 RepID=A0A0H2RNT0_9AGAM|nr:hypothetical protein SCHPADRAFT_906283 [Schizopora paradoxa]